ncbi:MAG TPA: esterase family protein [Candidatus Pullilachnospira intestinigallinarum]|nr:esterase family protein [Candidatus Pullilachnospira intestinigallinarum]
MAFMQVQFFSETLHMAVAADVIIPQAVTHEIGMDSKENKEGNHPVLWLLHGATDDHTTWQRRTSIERYASSRGLAVVMPSAHLSSYSNLAHGGAFYDYISEELPEIMRSFFPLSAQRELNFIAGNSMGGYGALKIGINHPDRYAAIGCFSSAANRGKPEANSGDLFDNATWKMRNFIQYGGKDLTGTYEDTFYMAEKNKSLPILPRIFHSCGKDDFLIDRARETRDFFQHMEGNPYHYVYEEHEGIHGWDYWDAHIEDFLDFLHLDITDNKFTN